MLTFPSTLSGGQRKFIHEQCELLGLVSQSTGDGYSRCISVSRSQDYKSALSVPLKLSAHSRTILMDFVFAQSSLPLSALSTSVTPRLATEEKETIPPFFTPLSGDILYQQQLSEKLSRLATQRLQQVDNSDASREYQALQAVRRKLPSFAKRAELLHMIKTNQVCVISGATGCGKTTQVPQFIVEDLIAEGIL